MKKVLILYATAGIGHKKASLAIKQALDEMKPAGVEATIMDSLDLTTKFFKWFYLQIYLLMVGKLPIVWGLSYYLTDNPLVNVIVSKLRMINNWAYSKRLRRYLLESQPDVIVSTHFFASEVISNMKAQGGLRSKLLTVVTDYRLHSWWVAKHTDMYVVGSDEAKGDLLRWGTPPERIKVLGIPAEPIFSKPMDVDAIRQKAGIKKDIPTILVIGGGFGVGPIIGIVETIGSLTEPVQVIAVCGHNEGLVKRLEAMKKSFGHTMDVFGFVQNVYEYMSISDILISKSGGITVTESLAKTLPMVVISPIIGQETRNCDFLLSNGAAIRADKLSDLRGILKNLLTDPVRLPKMKEAIGRIRKPAACYDIVKLAVEL